MPRSHGARRLCGWSSMVANADGSRSPRATPLHLRPHRGGQRRALRQAGAGEVAQRSERGRLELPGAGEGRVARVRCRFGWFRDRGRQPDRGRGREGEDEAVSELAAAQGGDEPDQQQALVSRVSEVGLPGQPRVLQVLVMGQARRTAHASDGSGGDSIRRTCYAPAPRPDGRGAAVLNEHEKRPRY